MSKPAVAARLRTTATRSVLAPFVMLLAVPFADAAPIQLTEAQFNAATAGLTTISEDFEGFASGDYASPVTTANGTVTTTGTVLRISNGFCNDADQCLFDPVDFTGVRTFSGLPTGTTLWAVDDFAVNVLANVFRITVSGNSGVSVFDVTASGIYGFGDPTGLISISFQNLGSGPFNLFGAYSFDDVVTAGPSAVPEPASLTLLGLGLAGMGARRWRQRKRA